MKQKPSLQHLTLVAAGAITVVSLIFLIIRSWGVPPLVNWIIVVSLLIGVIEAIIQGSQGK